VGQAILTELEVEGERPVDDPIALASYPIDCHDCRYLVDGRGRLAVEGDLNVVHRPVGISMRCLVPATAPPGFVTATAISTTHVGWCAVRTEPVFAMMGQAAGLMVSLVARKCAPVESLSYDQLRAALEERGAVLSADS